MKLLKLVVAVLFVIPCILVLAIGILAYHAWIGYWVWNNLAVVKGMPHIPFMVWMAFALIHSAVFSTGYSTLFPNETPEDKARRKKFMFEEMIIKPLLILVIADILKVFFL